MPEPTPNPHVDLNNARNLLRLGTTRDFVLAKLGNVTMVDPMSDDVRGSTVAEICKSETDKGHPPPDFFADYTSTEGAGSYGKKCHGIKQLRNADALKEPDRYIGFYGAKELTFTEPFELQRGHKIVVVKASKERPFVCTERIYPQI